MTWPDFRPPLQGNIPELLPADLAAAREYSVELATASGPGPMVEVRELFRRLYGEPQDCGTPNPYVAPYHRWRAKVRLTSRDGGHEDITASIEYRYWPTLKLGYIESVHVTSEIRHQGMGVRLLNFAIDHMRRKGGESVHAFTVSQEGLSLLAGVGFAADAPEDENSPWRCWVSIIPKV